MKYTSCLLSFAFIVSLVCKTVTSHVAIGQSAVPFEAKRASSCSELWLRYNITQSGNYTLDLSSDRNKSNLVGVECDLRAVSSTFDRVSLSKAERVDASLLDPTWIASAYYEILTIIHHDSEETKTVKGYESPGSFIRNVDYYTVQSMEQIENIINSSFTCQQFIRWDCCGSTFSFWYPKTHHSWWVDRYGKGQNYWGYAEPNSNSCGCFPNCIPTTKNSTCNCDANLKSQWLEDSGLLLERNHLPVTQLRFGDTGETREVGSYTLGPLKCRQGGHRTLFMGIRQAPAVITSPGYPDHYPPEFRIYEWVITVAAGELIELVFPEYDIVHYGAYISVHGCRHALEIDVYSKQEGETVSEWKRIESLRREKASPPYYVTDGRATKFVMRLITCNQVSTVEQKGFKAEFRRSKCAGCNAAAELAADRRNISTSCFISPSQCVYIYSNGYPFPHYILGTSFGYHLLHHWNLTTKEGNSLQIEFNDFDVNSTPGQNNCEADLLTVQDEPQDKSIVKKVDYCNINRFNIGKFNSASHMTLMRLKTKVKKVGNSRGIHATIASIPAVSNSRKWVPNAAQGKPTDQSSTIHSLDSSLAVDGTTEQLDPSKCTSTDYQVEPWWRVNLQKRHRIHGVKIYSLIHKQKPSASSTGTSDRLRATGGSGEYDGGSQEDTEISWPSGEYALPMPVSGCPTNDASSEWLTGMRFHAVKHDKTYDDKAYPYWSESIMLKGGATELGIEQHFCVHSTVASNESDFEHVSRSNDATTSWMPGKYCIFQYGDHCPENFQSGSITWFDKSHNNQTSRLNLFNSVRGHVPSGHYTTHNTTINFCCRDDGQPEVAIRLPKTRPFYLLQYGQICQEVEGMSEVGQYFHYEEEVILTSDHSSSRVDFIYASDGQLKFQDLHPRVDAMLFDRGMSLHYCYYDITNKLKGFQVLVDTTQDTNGYGRFYDEESGIARSVHKKFLSAVECASYSVTANEFEHITLNCAQPIEGQFVIIFMKDRKDALQLCEVRVFGEESCGRPLGMATEEILDTAITASSFDTKDGLLNHYYNVRQHSPKAWCAAGSDPDKYIQIDLRLQNSNVVSDAKVNGDPGVQEVATTTDGGAGESTVDDLATNYVTLVGVAMQGMQNTFKIYFVTQFQLLFSNDSLHWIYEEEPIGKQKVYKCVQCDAQDINGNEVVMYNLLKPIVARFIRVQIVSFRGGPCMRLELIGCRGDRKNPCQQVVTASTPGVISSPNYPFYYAQYKSCTWKVVPSKPNGHIELDFIVLDLAPEEKSGGKCHDRLVIHHASNRQSTITIESGSGQHPLLQHRSSSSFRQQYFPKKIISNGPIMLTLNTCFRFSMSRYQGFLLRFRETDCPGCGIGDSRCSFIHNCSSLCGQILSINYPLNYINSHRCQWLIRAPPGYYFNVTIEDFDLPDKPANLFSRSSSMGSIPRKRSQTTHQNPSPSGRSKHGCMSDHLSFTDSSNGMLLGRYCNSNKPPKYILSNWNELMIEFSTDSSTTGRGFRLKYKAQKYQLLEEAKPLLQPPQPNFTCPTSWLYFRGYCYAAFVESESLQYNQAEEKCSQKVKGRDGHLVSITDYLEMNVVHYWIIEHWKMTPHQSIYIGLIDTNREGFYNWSDGNPMSYTDWYRSNPYQSVSSSTEAQYNTWSSGNTNTSEQSSSDQPNQTYSSGSSEQPIMSLDEMNQHFIQNNQPDGGAFEDCTVINFYSIHSTANWHDIPCSLGKKVIPVKMGSNSTGGNSSGNNRRPSSPISDGLIRSYICKIDSTSSLHQHSPRKPLFTKQISDEEKAALATKVSGNRYFVCNNFEVISNMFRCDGTPNCRDGSDETEGCPVNSQQCLESQFQCDSGHCIAIGKYCNFIEDCGDGSDEVKCVRRRCRQEPSGKQQEFKCNNGQCIPISKRCDLMPDCLDQSDEGQSCTAGQCNLNKTFQCYFGTCVPLYTLCDKHRDCPGKFYEDEHESVCAALFDLENGASGSATQASGNEEHSAFDLMRSPLRMPPPISSRFFRMKRDSNDEQEEVDDDDMTVTLSAYIANQMQSEKVRTIREANLQGQTGQSCDKNRRRTCQDLLQHFGINSEGYYELQPSSQTKLTLKAYCRFLNSTHAMTIIHHDTEDRLYVRSSVDGPGSYVRSITYESSISLIVALIDHSAHCRQLLSYECSGSGFYFNSSRPNSWWISRYGYKEYNWGGDTNNACACHPNCSPADLRCNCDSGQRFNWTRDYGYVENRTKLPIIQVAFGDVSRIGQLGYVRVGELECIGNKQETSSDVCEQKSTAFGNKLAAPQQARLFQCQSGHVINGSFICLYEFDQLGYQIGCRDVSHLANCEHYECPPDYVKCPGSYCIPHRYMCNGKWDCVGGSDEIDCARYTCPGRYKCANESSCILLHQLCDSFRHCPLGDDEWLCDLTCPESCICTGMYVNCRDSNITLAAFQHMSKETRKLDLSGNHLGPDLANIDFSPFADLGELILHNNDIEIIRERKFVHLTNLYKLDLRHNRIKVIEDGAFAGLGQVRSLLLEDNPTLEEIQSSAFVGLVSLVHLNISNTRLAKLNSNVFLQMSSLQTLILVDNQIDTIEKGAFNELTWLVSLDLRGNTITNFPKDMFSPLKPLKTLSTDSFKFCCLANSVVGLPFSRCLPPQDEISDCQDLMSNTVQRLILWVLGIVAFFGNLLVVIWRFKTRNQTNRVSSTLILSLGCSDFLMGIYLLIIASVDEYYRGSYIEHSDYWKTSSLCKICGFLSTISSEMSVATLVYITIDRLISISFSFSGYRFTLKFTKRLLIITWIFMFLVSAVPLLPIDYFKGQFYSRSGVCLALHITTHRSPGWEYSVAVFLFANLLAFLMIVFCYCYMYSTIKRSKKKMKSMITQKQDREARIGWQMLYIVVSNFCCWFPVIIMGMLALGGIAISGSAYSWTAVFVLPLNSATDPLIYTLIQFIQNFYANREQERQMLLATAGGTSRHGRGALLRLAQSSMPAFNGQSHTKILRGFSKLSSDLIAESSVSSTTNGNFAANSSHHLQRSSSYLQANALLLRPPSGYQTLGEFIRTHENITTRDLLEICHSVSANLKEFHQMGFALGTIGFDNIFVTKDPVPVRVPASNARKDDEASAEETSEPIDTFDAADENEQAEDEDGAREDEDDSEIEYRFQTYIPGAGYAYKVAYNDEDVDDYAVNVEEFGLVVKRMLQHYHARQLQRQSSSNSQTKKGQENKTNDKTDEKLETK